MILGGSTIYVNDEFNTLVSKLPDLPYSNCLPLKPLIQCLPLVFSPPKPDPLLLTALPVFYSILSLQFFLAILTYPVIIYLCSYIFFIYI